MIFFKPTTFKEQKKVFDNLYKLVDDSVGLVVVDSIAMLYRLALGMAKEVCEVNAALGKQIATLTKIARKWQIPVVMTNQVYADFENKERVKMVGGDLLKYGSKCLIELKVGGEGRKAVLRKHRSLKEGKEINFEIVNEGIRHRE